MRLYHAGTEQHKLHPHGLRRTLLTYPERATPCFKFWVGDTSGQGRLTGTDRPEGVDIFLDSGAFMVFTGKAKVDLGEYCDYLDRNLDRFTVYAALDVIGDHAASARNVEAMEARGLRPLPTFHRGSPWAVLERMVESHDYIAIGGLAADVSRPGERLAFASEENTGPFLDGVFRRLERHWPIKVHAFGLIAQWALERYPFYSADSASAERAGGYGRVLRWRPGGRFTAWSWKDDALEYLDGRFMDLPGQVGRDARIVNNFQGIARLERHLTDVWRGKGIDWDADDGRTSAA